MFAKDDPRFQRNRIMQFVIDVKFQSIWAPGGAPSPGSGDPLGMTHKDSMMGLGRELMEGAGLTGLSVIRRRSPSA